MTPGQIITACEIAAAALVCLVAWSRGRVDLIAPCLAFIAVMILMRVFKAALPGELHFIAWAALLVSCGSWCARRGLSSGNHAISVCGALLIASGLCYAVAEATSARTVLWSMPMTAADCLSFAALAALLMGAVSGSVVDGDALSDRVAQHALGSNSDRGRGLAGGHHLGAVAPADGAVRADHGAVAGSSEAVQ